jgi:beta-phosphoglucomutase
MKTKIAVIFDFNGVVIDDRAYQAEAWITFAKRHGREIDESIFKEHISGKRNVESMPWLFNRELRPGELRRFSDEKETIYDELYEPHVVPMQGLERFLNTLEARRIPFALASSASTRHLKKILAKTGLAEKFKTILDSTHVARGKPDPEIFLKAAELLGIEPKSCVVFEDAKSGIEAARRTGMKVVGVTTTHSLEELKPFCDLVIIDFTELSVESICRLPEK